MELAILNFKSHRMVFALTAALAICFASQVSAGTLENLERERAQFLNMSLDPSVSQSERQPQIESARKRLVDLERMVLRDESLKGKSVPIVQRAFANYDLTFLAHSSIEKNRALLDTWMEQIGLTTNALMSARVGNNLSQLEATAK